MGAVRIAATSGEDVEDQGIQDSEGPAGPKIPRSGYGRRQDQQVTDPALEILQGCCHGPADAVGLAGKVDTQESPSHDPERQPDELGCDVERLPTGGVIPPSFEHHPDRFGHQPRQGDNPQMMESRLGQPAQPAPGRPLGRHQALADDHLGAIVIPAPRIVLRVVDQHMLDMVGVRDLMEHQRAQLVTEHVPVPLQAVQQEPERIAPRSSHRPKEGDRHELTHARSCLPPDKSRARHGSLPTSDVHPSPLATHSRNPPWWSETTSNLRRLSMGPEGTGQGGSRRGDSFHVVENQGCPYCANGTERCPRSGG